MEVVIETLIEMLEVCARDAPDQAALVFEGESPSYGELRRRSRTVTEGLRRRGLGLGARVVIALPNGPDFLVAFFGVQGAGAVPVPVYADSGTRRLLDIAGLCGASGLLVAAEERAAAVREAGAEAPPVWKLAELTEAPAGGERAEPDFRLRADDLALIQYTSGSTGDPKGVQLTHGDILTNMRQMIAGMHITETDVFVSWLPMCHDMGLILMTLVPLYLGARLIVLPTRLTQPRRWLAAIEEHRGTFTAAPDFAYRLCLQAVRDAAELDLRSLRVALDAAEPVRAGTLRGFEAAFGLENVVVAGYGLAEATVGVSMWPPGRPPKVDDRGLVSVGPGFPGVELRIARGGRPAPAGEVGEILVRSPAATRGYFGNPKATARLLTADGYLRTGDLGYLDAEGDLFIVGRTKNLIVRAGQTLAPQEIEESIDALPFVRRTAAMGIDREGVAGEQIYLFAEVRPPTDDGEVLEERVIAIVESFLARFGFRPGRVFLLAPRSIPRTANGKVQHARLREDYLGGRLRAAGRIVFPDY